MYPRVRTYGAFIWRPPGQPIPRRWYRRYYTSRACGAAQQVPGDVVVARRARAAGLARASVSLEVSRRTAYVVSVCMCCASFSYEHVWIHTLYTYLCTLFFVLILFRRKDENASPGQPHTTAMFRFRQRHRTPSPNQHLNATTRTIDHLYVFIS